MTGAYRVSFHFEETFACVPDYVPTPAYDESAVELVRVVEDRGDFISLQHLLVVDYESGDPMVVKHWRQDWTYEDTELVLFRGRDAWERVSVPSEQAAGTWTQAVYQVGDSPRYEGRGRWRHSRLELDLGVGRDLASAAPAREAARGLPARSPRATSIRSRQRAGPTRSTTANSCSPPTAPLCEVLVHEEGFNTYRPDPELALEIAEAYWDGTQAFWADVRAVWDEVLSSDSAFRIEGGRTTNAFSTLADEYLEGAWRDEPARLARLREVIDEAVAPLAPGNRPGSADPEQG